MKPLKNNKQKIPKLFEELKENRDVINQELKKYRIDYNQINHTKKFARILIADKVLGVNDTSDAFPFHVEFINFPDEFIMFTKIKQFFSCDDAYNMESIWSTSQENVYWWERKDDGRAILHGRFQHSSPRSVNIQGTTYNVPVYHNIEIIILNEGIYHEIQSNKT